MKSSGIWSVREDSGRNVADTILFAEAHGIKETFDDVRNVFGHFSGELNEQSKNEVIFQGNHYQIVIMLVGDFKVYYSLLCMKSARCNTPLYMMDQRRRHLSQSKLQ